MFIIGAAAVPKQKEVGAACRRGVCGRGERAEALREHLGGREGDGHACFTIIFDFNQV